MSNTWPYGHEMASKGWPHGHRRNKTQNYKNDFSGFLLFPLLCMPKLEKDKINDRYLFTGGKYSYI
jgi:hypothetical protein